AAVVGDVADVLKLTTRVSLAAYPCRPEAVRGLTATVCISDELAFYIASDGRPTDLEMLRALRTRLATTRGRLIVLSSPYAQAGALFDLHKNHYGRESSTLVIQTSAPMLNPLLPPDYL